MTNNGGSTRILVRLDVPNIAALTRTAVAQQQRARGVNADAQLAAAITTIADAELAKLQPGSHTVNRRYQSLPFLAMTVTREALDGLEASPVVLDVAEDRLFAPTLNNTVNFTGASTSWNEGFDGSGWYVAILDTGIRASHNFFAGKDIVEACFSSGGDCPNGLTAEFGPGAAAHHSTSPVCINDPVTEGNPCDPNADCRQSQCVSGRCIGGLDVGRACSPNSDCGSGQCVPRPSSDHGSHVSGIAAGNGPDFPAAGVAKGANIIAIQVFSQFINNSSCGPSGSCVLSFTSDQVAAMDYVFSQRLNFQISSVNMSLGGGQFFSQGSCDGANSFEKLAIDNLKNVGIATVIAAGNDGFCDSLSAPGCISSAIAVGATTDADVQAVFSNFHAGMLDIYAPGVDVISAEGASDSDYGNMSGTSMATPHVTGTWAIMKQENPNASVDEILTALKTTGATVSSGCVGTPAQRRIQINDALDLVRPPCSLDSVAAADAAVADRFAGAVAVGGDVMVAGAMLSDGAFSSTGSAYVYRFDGVAWPQEAKLTASVPTGSDQFGNSVAVSGDVVVVGAHRDGEGGSNAGAAYVFRFDGTSWSQEQKLMAADPGVNDFFGRSVAVDGDVAVVGAFVDDCADGTNDCGSAYVFRHAAGVWTQEQKLIASDGNTGDFFGISVSISGSAIVVGAQNADCTAGGVCGAAYVYRFDGTTWTEEAKLTAPGQAVSDRFGISVSVSTDVIAVGASGRDCVNTAVDCGAAYVFRFDGASWNTEATLTAWDAVSGDAFGGSVAVSGDVAAVGAANKDCSPTASGCGAGYVYRFDGSAWNVEPKLSHPAIAASDQFGSTVAVDGMFVVAGAALQDCAAGSDCGAAHIFSVAGDCNLNRVDDLCEILADPSLDLDGNRLLDQCACDQASTPVQDLRGIKNRFLSFTAGDPGRLQAVRVTFRSLPPPFDLWNGATLWVGPTGQVTEAGGSIQPQPGFPNFTAAVLQCQPFFTDWSLLGEVHVTHEGIIPLGVYEIAVLDESCLPTLESSFSPPLVVTNPKMGDTLKNLINVPALPPDGQLTIDDVLGVLGRFASAPGSIIKSRADLEPGCPDLTINISDALLALSGFAGLSYPFTPSALDPCASVCNIPVP